MGFEVKEKKKEIYEFVINNNKKEKMSYLATSDTVIGKIFIFRPPTR